MKTNKEKWIASIFDSVADSQRAVPNPMLFNKIEETLDGLKKRTIMPIHYIRRVAAAIIFLLLLNIAAIQYILTSRETLTEEKKDKQTLISDYKLYN